MSVTESFYETLFEVSNDYRYNILQLLKTKPMRITDISKILELTTQEISRHASRLSDTRLIYKDVEGLFHLTPYGDLINVLLEDFLFITENREYFLEHTVSRIKPSFIKTLSNLSDSILVDNTLEFLHLIDKLIKEANEKVWLIVDHYPVNYLDSIIKAMNRGVKFRIIELSEVSSGPHMNLASLEEANNIERTRNTELSEQRTLEEIGVFMFLSENQCALAFPSEENKFDYKGFIATDKRAIQWCLDLYTTYWNETSPRYKIPRKTLKKEQNQTMGSLENGNFIILGQRTINDAQIVQDAVDQYEKILLRGHFNFGDSTVKISKSVRISGELKNNKPSTIIYKRGWSFPSDECEAVFEVNGEEAEVIIENIHFTDFNCTCINARRGKRLNVTNNWMTLQTGYGRGWKYLQYGDIVCGIWVGPQTENIDKEEKFADGVLINGNYLDFSLGAPDTASFGSTEIANQLSTKPDLSSHEYYIGIGINITNFSDNLEIKNNKIRNMNSSGISIIDNFIDSDVKITENIIESTIPGSYPFRRPEAGNGILIQNSSNYWPSTSSMKISGNILNIDRPDYCGIVLKTNIQEGLDRTEKTRIIKNNIRIKEGQACIKVDSGMMSIIDNKFSGNAFFGVMVKSDKITPTLASQKSNDYNANNDITELQLIDPWFRITRNEPVK
ncbi:ArsR family transcriptional regulator [Candidatus Bathyarchaeota archaeon]|nr:ArsR family transcriptional regulator [Candidatus Bathyarchaeota archaeon]